MSRLRERCLAITAGYSPLLILSWLSFATVIGWLWIDSALPFPYIFADETGFMIPARAIADPNYHPDGGGYAYALRSQSPLHSVLFSAVFSSGDGFFAHAKFINCLLCGLMIFPAYFVARRVAGTGAALAFGALVALNPWNSYTAHFMPESLYACLFWWFAWACLSSLQDDHDRRWKAVASASGCALLGVLLFFTKPHGLTLIAAGAGTFLLRGFRSRFTRTPEWWLGLAQVATYSIVICACLTCFAFAANRTFGDVLFAGRYQDQAGGIFSFNGFGVKLEGGLRQVSGHLGHAAVLYAVPFSVSLCLLWRAIRPASPTDQRLADSIAFSALAFIFTLGVTIKFACDIMVTEDSSLIHRLSERYYGFLLPLLALPMLSSASLVRRPVEAILAAVIAVGAIATLAAQRAWFQINTYDAPQFYWLSPAAAQDPLGSWLFWLSLALAAAHVIYFLVTRRYSWRAFFLVSVVVSVVATVSLEHRKWHESRDWIHLHAFSQTTRHIVNSDWRHTILVGDPFMTSCFQMMLDGLPNIVILQPGSLVPADRILSGTRWIIRLQENSLPKETRLESIFRYEGAGVFDISRVSP